MAASGGFSYSINQQTLGAAGFSVNLNLDRPLYLTLANLSASGGPTITLTLGNSAGNSQTFTCQAGAVIGPLPWTFRTVTVTGSGATIIGIASTSPVNRETLLAMAVPISGKVSTSIDGQTVGVAPADSFAGTAISPSLSAQLPASLLNGQLNTRALTASDVLTPYGKAGLAFPQDTLGNPYHVPVLPGTSTPIASRALDYDANGYPIHSPYGKGGLPFPQDSAGNVYHVPVLQGTSTPINTQALQYDTNGYPLHTLGNVTSYGGDTPPAPSTSQGSVGNTSGASFYLNYVPAAGTKLTGVLGWVAYLMFGIGDSTTQASVSVNANSIFISHMTPTIGNAATTYTGAVKTGLAALFPSSASTAVTIPATGGGWYGFGIFLSPMATSFSSYLTSSADGGNIVVIAAPEAPQSLGSVVYTNNDTIQFAIGISVTGVSTGATIDVYGAVVPLGGVKEPI